MTPPSPSHAMSAPGHPSPQVTRKFQAEDMRDRSSSHLAGVIPWQWSQQRISMCPWADQAEPSSPRSAQPWICAPFQGLILLALSSSLWPLVWPPLWTLILLCLLHGSSPSPQCLFLSFSSFCLMAHVPSFVPFLLLTFPLTFSSCGSYLPLIRSHSPDFSLLQRNPCLLPAE